MLRSIPVDIEKLTGNKHVLAVSAHDVVDYKDNKPTDVVIGRRYEIVLPLAKYDHAFVKVIGPNQIDVSSNTYVEFTNLIAVPYNRNGRGEFSLRAESIRVVDNT